MNKKTQVLFFFSIIFSGISYYAKFLGKVPLNEKISFKFPFWVFALLSVCTLSMILWDKFGEDGIKQRAKELNKFIIFYSLILFPILYAMTASDWNILLRFLCSIIFASIFSLWVIFLIKKKRLRET